MAAVNNKLRSLLRLVTALAGIILFVFGSFMAWGYAHSTVGCDNVISADPKTSIIILIAGLPLLFFAAVNAAILLGRNALATKWYARLWLLWIVLGIVIIIWLAAGLRSSQFWAGYCF